jgi:hypothetical protein
MKRAVAALRFYFGKALSRLAWADGGDNLMSLDGILRGKIVQFINEASGGMADDG